VAPDINVGESCLRTLLLFLNPGFDPYLLHSLPICDQSRIAFGDLKHPLAWVFLAKGTDFDSSLEGAFSYAAEGRPTALPTSRAGFVRIAKVGQESPKLTESGEFLAPKLIALIGH